MDGGRDGGKKWSLGRWKLVYSGYENRRSEEADSLVEVRSWTKCRGHQCVERDWGPVLTTNRSVHTGHRLVLFQRRQAARNAPQRKEGKVMSRTVRSHPQEIFRNTNNAYFEDSLTLLRHQYIKYTNICMFTF